MKTIPLLLAAALALAAPAFAQTDPPTEPATEPGTDPGGDEPKDPPTSDEPLAPEKQIEDGKLYYGLLIEELETALGHTGFTFTRSPAENGYGFDVTTTGGLKFSAYLGGCSEVGEKRCSDLNLLSFPFLETSQISLKKLNEWNIKSWAAAGVIYKDGTSQVTTNLGVNGGVTTQWVVNRLLNYEYSLGSFSDFVAGKVAAPP